MRSAKRMVLGLKSVLIPMSRNEKGGASQVLARYPEVAVIGAGLIGLSWAALFLANGPRLRIETDLEAATRDADLVQESGPEQIDFKRECFARLEQFVKPDALLLSSTSSLRATNIARDMEHPERMMVGPPFNPPHVMPLVEIVPGQKTAPEAVQEALSFYRALGKAPVV